MTLTDFPSYHRLHYPDHPDATPLVVAPPLLAPDVDRDYLALVGLLLFALTCVVLVVLVCQRLP